MAIGSASCGILVRPKREGNLDFAKWWFQEIGAQLYTQGLGFPFLSRQSPQKGILPKDTEELRSLCDNSNQSLPIGFRV